jgi:hypothetical protein
MRKLRWNFIKWVSCFQARACIPIRIRECISVDWHHNSTHQNHK